MSNESAVPNPRRVAAGRANRAKRGPLTRGGKQRLRAAALQYRPWIHSTGPRTAEGKAQAVKNGKTRQLGPRSVREIRVDLAHIAHFINLMSQARALAERAKSRAESAGSPVR